MLAKRIIHCLDVTGGRVVKGVNFINLRDARDPVEPADRHHQPGADGAAVPGVHAPRASTSPPFATPAPPASSPTATISRAPTESSSSTSPPRATTAPSWPTSWP